MIQTSIKNHVIVKIFTLLPLFWAFSGLFYSSSGKKQIGILMLLSIVLMIYTYGVTQAIANIKENKVLWILLFSLLYSFCIFTLYDYNFGQFRSLFFSMLFLIFVPKQILTKKLLYAVILFGAFFVISYALWFTFVQGMGRSWPVNVIPFSTFSSIIAIFSFILFFYEEKKLFKCILLISFLLSICSVAIGQSRGVWLALMITMLLAFVYLHHLKKINYKSIFVLLIVVGLALIAAYPKIDQRVTNTIHEYNVIKSGVYSTSIGLRIKMWSVGFELSKISPILGLRDDHLVEFNKKYKHTTDPDMLAMTTYTPPHYHMEMLNTFVKSGIVGLFIFLLPLFYVVYNFISHKNLGSSLLLAMMSIYLIAGLTDIPMTHGNHMIFFWLLLYYLTNNGFRLYKKYLGLN
ncbi:MAG: hypothetical protein OFPII_42810 [Osedax symbiont Rs1]|nr:MAG: hypothetical protein OFPII_42810 [Osedax symbiont Rs1]